MNTPRTEFSQALKAIATERGLDPDVILETIKQAIIAAYKRDAKEQGTDVEAFEYDAVIDSVSGETKVFAWPAPAEDLSEEEKEKARKENMKAKEDVTPPGFGRIAAQTAKQVIHQKIREAEKGAIMEEFEEKVGSLASGLILRFDGSNVRVDLGRTEAIMLAEDRIPSERLNLNQRLTFLIKAITETPRGKEIFLSRSSPEFVEKLFAREVPEISSGSVKIKAIAREAGVRTKIAVASEQTGVDPVGSCVGQKGVRVQAVTNEIGGERVDVIPWSDDVSELIKSSLSPAENVSVELDDEKKVAKVLAPEDQLSMAIGKDGQNVRLTAKLTGFRIEVEGNGEVTEPVAPEELKEPEAEETQKEEVPVAETPDEPKKEESTEEKEAEAPKEEEKVEEEVKEEKPEEELKETESSEPLTEEKPKENVSEEKSEEADEENNEEGKEEPEEVKSE